ncbi:MAG: AIM24 family protein [bacterium]|nr:AIM24 family protein [bacterium]
MYKINNLLNNENIKVTYEMGPVRILEHYRNMSMDNLADVPANYRYSQMNVRNRQALITLEDSSFMVSAGAMQWTLGDVKLSSNVKGVGDYFGKALSGMVTGEGAVKPVYTGTGLLMLEPTLKHLFPMRVEKWGGITLTDGAYMGCETSVSLTVKKNAGLRTGLAGEGFFNLCCSGSGVLLVESPVPYAHLMEVVLEDDELRVDGNMAVAWSSSLNYTTELAVNNNNPESKESKGFFGKMKDAVASGATGEGYVNAFRGTGKVLVALVE